MAFPSAEGACEAKECMLPSNGFVLMNEKASAASMNFVAEVEKDMDRQWTQSKAGGQGFVGFVAASCEQLHRCSCF